MVWVKLWYLKRLWKTDIIKTITKEYFSNFLGFSQFDSFIAVKSRITWTYGTAATQDGIF